MKTNTKNPLMRLMMIVTMLSMVFGLTGGMPVKAAAEQASYIVQATSAEQAASLVEKYNGEVTSQLDIINGVAANLSSVAVSLLHSEAAVSGITPNHAVNQTAVDFSNSSNDNAGSPTVDTPVAVGADNVWSQGDTGSGVTVAVVDTGIANLPQLNTNSQGQGGRIVGWTDVIDHSKSPIDPNGHGTHIAGIIANSEVGANGKFNGIAPDANLVGVRVLNDQGAGTYETVISGLQWVLKNRNRYNIRVVNLSLVSPVQSPYWADPLDDAVTALWASGMTVVVAAGNTGPNPMTVNVPGNNPYVITVGAYTDNFTPTDWTDDYIAPFSSAGPTLDGFAKPDVVAPGGHIVSLTPADSVLASQYPANVLPNGYFKMAGTSMAAGVTSGVAALVIASNPKLSNDQVKQRLTSTALLWSDDTDILYSIFQQGAGRLNAYDAVFSSDMDSANDGMNIRTDLNGNTHYEGFGYFDPGTKTFKMRGPFDGGAKGGRFGSWSGKWGSWSGKFGSWSGKFGSWSGKFGSWSGKYGSWSGKFGSWSGKSGSWSGGYTTWMGKAGSWSGKAGSWSGATFTDSAFIANFAAGLTPDVSSASSIDFLLEP